MIPLVSFRDAWNSLTKLERKYQLCQCHGMNPENIAEQHRVDAKTVKNHLTNAHRKMRPAFPGVGRHTLKCVVCFQLGKSLAAIMKEEGIVRTTGE